MIKSVGLFKRKAGMSREDFIRYYENNHAPLALSLLPQIAEYRRGYIIPGSLGALGNGKLDFSGFDFDVMTETWVKDDVERLAMERAMSDPTVAKAISQDEENFFDRSRMLMFAVEEYRSAKK
jgi:hypothetical protein